ncbi:MAG: hypothetical protein WAL91_06180, partial [Propionicimonas sp.]
MAVLVEAAVLVWLADHVTRPRGGAGVTWLMAAHGRRDRHPARLDRGVDSAAAGGGLFPVSPRRFA